MKKEILFTAIIFILLLFLSIGKLQASSFNRTPFEKVDESSISTASFRPFSPFSTDGCEFCWDGQCWATPACGSGTDDNPGNVNAAPVGSGILLLLGMAMVYVFIKMRRLKVKTVNLKNKND
jgi:hypothetical protein